MHPILALLCPPPCTVARAEQITHRRIMVMESKALPEDVWHDIFGFLRILFDISDEDRSHAGHTAFLNILPVSQAWAVSGTYSREAHTNT